MYHVFHVAGPGRLLTLCSTQCRAHCGSKMQRWTEREHCSQPMCGWWTRYIYHMNSYIRKSVVVTACHVPSPLVSGPLTQTCVSSHQEIWTQANTTDLDESPNMKRNFVRPSQCISRPTNPHPLRHVARTRCFFFFVMKNRCHESLTRQER